MAQKTNLNISPYFDDFSEKDIGAKYKNYYKVLFNPGRAIQARELNTLQSILQDQVETFGSHIFKEGSLVIPGNIAFDNQFYAVKLNPQQFGVDIISYLNQFKGKTIVGQTSGITAYVQLVQFPNLSLGIEYPTIYVKYINSDNNFEINPFQDNEPLYVNETVGAIISGTIFASTIASNSTSVASAVSIGEGVYFIRGTFVRVQQQTIVLDYYDNTPSYRVGLQVVEQIVTPKNDSSLYDNAKGFTNYSAPGADRFQISLILTKKLLDDFNDTDFVELLRIRNGAIQKIETKSQYSILKDYIAQRTYDESGNYVVNPFKISLHNSLNNRLGNDGLFFENETTDQQNTPNDDLMCVKLSPGKAYVQGYDIEKSGTEILDVSKPRTTQTISGVSVPFDMGNLVIVNNVSGTPKQKGIIYLQSQRKTSNTVSSGSTIGCARIYSFSLTDAAYSDQSTNWNLYLYDVQIYTEITVNSTLSSAELPQTSYIKGKSSGASGYVVLSGSGTNTFTLRQVSGSFSVGEQILINGSEKISRIISSIKSYSSEDIKSLYQPSSISGFTTSFLSDVKLENKIKDGNITITVGSGGISTATIASPATFQGVKIDSIIKYTKPGSDTESYNKVVSISPTLNSVVLSDVNSVTAVCDGSLPSEQFSGNYSLGISKIKNDDRGFLYSQLPNSNIASVDLQSSTLSFSAQTNTGFSPAPSTTITVSVSDFNIGINSTTAKFQSFDEERYSIFYTDGSIENLTQDKVSFPNQNQVTFSNISNKQITAINATFIKNGIQSKIKQYQRSKTLNVVFSNNQQSGIGINTSINDGLSYNQYYGLRVQDEEISLNYPDVANIVAIYESLDTNAPILDRLSFDSTSNVFVNAIIGENILGNSSNAIARVVLKPLSDTIDIVYLNGNQFIPGEIVTFEESNIITKISSITLGRYNNITNKFILDKGQKDQYYDYSKVIRKTGESTPSKQLLIVFDYYTVPSNDSGDVFTVNSYESERYLSDIPKIGRSNVRATDTLDFRPRVSNFTKITASPFDFSERSFNIEPKVILTPNENSLVNYEVYLPRIDKIYLDRLGNFTVSQGVPALNPTSPLVPEDAMEIASITLPAYLYNTNDAIIKLIDNRRYTMRDIGKIEDRVENLEKVTSLSLLELNVQNLQIQDAQGLNRFKSGFFVDDFKTNNFIDLDLSTVQIDTENSEMRPLVSRNSLNLSLSTAENITDETFDINQDITLLDPNVQKTNEVVSLKYDSVKWIEQTFATKVENVNPFHIISYSGNIKLSPSSDSWVRTIRLSDIFRAVRQRLAVPRRRRRNIPRVVVETTDRVISTGKEIYMRSRNTGFFATSLKSFTKYYQFLDGNSGVDFIPKLLEIATDSTLENYGSSVPFLVGETVTGTFNGVDIIKFRVAKSNHKEGVFNNPSLTYNINPYLNSETIPEQYSSSSKILNIDINSLCLQTQGLYSGYVTIGTKLVGRTSGAVAYVKDLRLVSDENGSLYGSFFLRDPLTDPPPAVRITTGSKTYKLTSSQTNQTPLPGSKLISSAETVYKAEGIWEQRQRTITTIRRTFYDPLAQSFTVGGVADTENGNAPNEDVNGAYLTAVDLYFANRDSGNLPITIEIRTVELGTPTTTVLGEPVTLRPSDINVSTNASVATKVTFSYPIYLAPGLQYAIVLLAPQTVEYEVWIAEMGQKTIETKNLPDSQAVRYTRQFAIGRLYKSQNGGEWTPNDYQDLKFKLYKAQFTSFNGSVFFNNPTLNESNGYTPTLVSNPITILPKEIKLGITTVTDSTTIGILTTGRKITSNSENYKYGYIVGTGSSVSSVGITTGGINYSTTNNVGTYSLTGNGTGLKLNITGVSNGLITNVTISNPGTGYKVGDVVGIVTSDVFPVGGSKALITISGIGTGIDTLYLSNVQGNSFTGELNYFDASGNLQVVSGIDILLSTEIGGIYFGNTFKVDHFDHGMNSNTNKVILSNIKTDVSPTTLLSPLLTTDNVISVGSTDQFTMFEGKPINNTGNPGFIKIGNEIIKYESVNANSLGTLQRGIDSTRIENHNTNTLVYKYEIGGVSLRRINKTHTISNKDIDINSYYIDFDRKDLDANMSNRENDNTPSGYPQLSFNSKSTCGGNSVTATENIQFGAVIPHLSLFNPSQFTSVSSQIRTISGTSISGNEISFADQGYENINLNGQTNLNSVRIVASKINEETYLNFLPKNKSFNLKVDLTTNDKNLSPLIFWNESSIEFLNNIINNPITNYPNDNRVNSILNDPHSAIYVSNLIQLSNPATSLKVILSSYKHASSDFRVLYSLVRPDTTEAEESFVLFPGYDNLTIDNNQDGYRDVIDPSKNSGLPDVFVPPSLNNEFIEYEFTAPNLGNFTGYTIKIVMSGTNQAYVPRFKDIRSLAIA